MKSIKFLVQLSLVAICVTNVICGPVWMSSSEDHLLKPRIRREEQQQITDVQKPIDQEPITLKPEIQDSPKKQQVDQVLEIQQQVKAEHASKQQDQPLKNEYTDERIVSEECSNTQDSSGNVSACSKNKPDYSKAIAIAAKGNAVAAVATAGLAAPVVLKSAKIAALAGLIPIKLAAKGAIIGTLIAKPIIIKSALVGATAVKLSHLLVGKPIAIGSNLLAGAEALRAKLKARRLNRKGCSDESGCLKEVPLAPAA